MAAMGRFFADQPFFRFAAVWTSDTEYPREHQLMAGLISVLKVRIIDILRRTPANSVALVFESSDRADSLLMEHFGTLELEENGMEISVERCLMLKSACSPGLEEADFVMHAVGRMARHRLAGNKDYPRDFDAVFRRCDPRFVSFMIIDRSEPQPCEAPDVAIGLGLTLCDPLTEAGTSARGIIIREK
jgi:hypothetical protein